MSWTKIKLFGEQTVSYIEIRSGIATQDEINEVNEYNYSPQWKDKNLFLANFDDSTFDAGNVRNLNGSLTGWQIYRQEVGSNTLKFIKEVDYNTTSITDYTPKNNTEYIYNVFPSTDTQIGSRLISDTIKTDWWNWSLIDLNPTNKENEFTVNNIWLFDLNLESSQMQQNLDKTTFHNFTRYPKTSSGKRNYLSGSISCLIGNIEEVTGNYIDTVKLQQDFIEFVNNGKRKILRDRKGNIIEVDLMSNDMKMNDIIPEQITTINFSWIQVGDAKDITVTN